MALLLFLLFCVVENAAEIPEFYKHNEITNKSRNFTEFANIAVQERQHKDYM